MRNLLSPLSRDLSPAAFWRHHISPARHSSEGQLFRPWLLALLCHVYVTACVYTLRNASSGCSCPPWHTDCPQLRLAEGTAHSESSKGVARNPLHECIFKIIPSSAAVPGLAVCKPSGGWPGKGWARVPLIWCLSEMPREGGMVFVCWRTGLWLGPGHCSQGCCVCSAPAAPPEFWVRRLSQCPCSSCSLEPQRPVALSWVAGRDFCCFSWGILCFLSYLF